MQSGRSNASMSVSFKIAHAKGRKWCRPAREIDHVLLLLLCTGVPRLGCVCGACAACFVKVHKKLFGMQLEIHARVRTSGIDKNACKNMLQTHFYSTFDESASLWCRYLPSLPVGLFLHFRVCVFTIANACCKRNVYLINSTATNSNNGNKWTRPSFISFDWVSLIMVAVRYFLNLLFCM